MNLNDISNTSLDVNLTKQNTNNSNKFNDKTNKFANNNTTQNFLQVKNQMFYLKNKSNSSIANINNNSNNFCNNLMNKNTQQDKINSNSYLSCALIAQKSKEKDKSKSPNNQHSIGSLFNQSMKNLYPNITKQNFNSKNYNYKNVINNCNSKPYKNEIFASKENSLEKNKSISNDVTSYEYTNTEANFSTLKNKLEQIRVKTGNFQSSFQNLTISGEEYNEKNNNTSSNNFINLNPNLSVNKINDDNTNHVILEQNANKNMINNINPNTTIASNYKVFVNNDTHSKNKNCKSNININNEDISNKSNDMSGANLSLNNLKSKNFSLVNLHFFNKTLTTKNSNSSSQKNFDVLTNDNNSNYVNLNTTGNTENNKNFSAEKLIKFRNNNHSTENLLEIKIQNQKSLITNKNKKLNLSRLQNNGNNFAKKNAYLLRANLEKSFNSYKVNNNLLKDNYESNNNNDYNNPSGNHQSQYSSNIHAPYNKDKDKDNLLNSRKILIDENFNYSNNNDNCNNNTITYNYNHKTNNLSSTSNLNRKIINNSNINDKQANNTNNSYIINKKKNLYNLQSDKIKKYLNTNFDSSQKNISLNTFNNINNHLKNNHPKEEVQLLNKKTHSNNIIGNTILNQKNLKGIAQEDNTLLSHTKPFDNHNHKNHYSKVAHVSAKKFKELNDQSDSIVEDNLLSSKKHLVKQKKFINYRSELSSNLEMENFRKMTKYRQSIDNFESNKIKNKLSLDQNNLFDLSKSENTEEEIVDIDNIDFNFIKNKDINNKINYNDNYSSNEDEENSRDLINFNCNSSFNNKIKKIINVKDFNMHFSSNKNKKLSKSLNNLRKNSYPKYNLEKSDFEEEAFNDHPDHSNSSKSDNDSIIQNEVAKKSHRRGSNFLDNKTKNCSECLFKQTQPLSQSYKNFCYSNEIFNNISHATKQTASANRKKPTVKLFFHNKRLRMNKKTSLHKVTNNITFLVTLQKRNKYH